eukprot:COSAG01_NODE_13967_length_1513_cov_3.613154_1_plen_27_part_10
MHYELDSGGFLMPIFDCWNANYVRTTQ